MVVPKKATQSWVNRVYSMQPWRVPVFIIRVLEIRFPIQTGWGLPVRIQHLVAQGGCQSQSVELFSHLGWDDGVEC